MGKIKDKFRSLAGVAGLIGVSTFGGAIGGATLSGLEQAVLSREAHAQVSGTPTVQEYNPNTGQLRVTDLSQRLAAGDEYLQHVTGFNFEDGNLHLLGTVSKEDNRTYYNPTDRLGNRLDADDFIQQYTEGFYPVKTRRLKISEIPGIPGKGPFALVYDGKTHIHGVRLGSTPGGPHEPLGDITQIFKNILGFVPVDIQSYNSFNGSSPYDDIIIVKKHDGTEYSGPAFNQLTASNLEGLFHDVSQGSIISLGALNIDGGLTDKLYAVRYPLQGQLSNLEIVADIITSNQNAIQGSSYRSRERIAKWNLPVSVFVDPSIDKRNVDEAMWQNFLETRMPYIIIDQDELPRILVRAGTDTDLGPRGLVDGVYSNNRAKSGLVVMHPTRAQYDPSARGLYQFELGHAMGVFDELSDLNRRNRILKALHFNMPHGARIETDGSWRVIVNTD